jgi:hypothetical protein
MNIELDRPCRVCGRDDWVRKGTRHDRATRFDAEVCGDRCRKLRERGHDLAYLRDWSPPLAQARRFRHEAITADIETWNAVNAMRRERRAAARNKRPPVFLKANPEPAPEEPPKHRGGGRFITI